MASLKFGYFCPLPPFGKLFSTKPNMVTNFLISILHILEAWRNLWTTYLCSTKFFNVYSNVGKNIVLKCTLRIRPDKVQKIRNCEKNAINFNVEIPLLRNTQTLRSSSPLFYCPVLELFLLTIRNAFLKLWSLSQLSLGPSTNDLSLAISTMSHVYAKWLRRDFINSIIVTSFTDDFSFLPIKHWNQTWTLVCPS